MDRTEGMVPLALTVEIAGEPMDKLLYDEDRASALIDILRLPNFSDEELAEQLTHRACSFERSGEPWSLNLITGDKGFVEDDDLFRAAIGGYLKAIQGYLECHTAGQEASNIVLQSSIVAYEKLHRSKRHKQAKEVLVSCGRLLMWEVVQAYLDSEDADWRIAEFLMLGWAERDIKEVYNTVQQTKHSTSEFREFLKTCTKKQLVELIRRYGIIYQSDRTIIDRLRILFGELADRTKPEEAAGIVRGLGLDPHLLPDFESTE